MKFLHLVFSNLMRKKLRTSLTVLSIFIAFMLYGILCTIKESFTAGIDVAGADRLVVRNKITLIQPLPDSYLQKIVALSGVDSAVHFTWFGGIYRDDAALFFPSMPVSDIDTFLDIYPEYKLSDEAKEKWHSTRTGVIVGKQTAERFEWKVGDRIPLHSPIWPRKEDQVWEFDIVGIYEGASAKTDITGFYFRYDYFNEGRERGEGLAGWYTVRVKDPDKAPEVASAIDSEFQNSPYETKAEPEGAFAQAFVQQMGDIGAILMSILSVVFFTILLVTGNTMAQSVRERTQELGVLKSMGFSDGLVLRLVLAESCLIVVVGGFIGIGLAWLMAAGGSPVPDMLPIFYFPTEYVIIGIGLVIALGLAAGIIPAIEARRLRIAVALRRNA
ncbi:MAG: FtsX-like permease family protein [Planctomycetes bacterium]|nr:FtsX-like permease family protein [Planctomycetota bacterium]